MTLALLGASAQAAQPSEIKITLAWDPNPEPDLESYVIHYGLRSGAYFRRIPVGNVTTVTLSLPLPAVRYYFACTARDTEGLEGDFSSEVFFDAPQADTSLLRIPKSSSGVEDRDLVLDFGEPSWDSEADWTILAPPSLGNLEQRGSQLVYLPRPHASGRDAFEIIGNLGPTGQPVKWVWEVDVLPENDPPIALAQELATDNASSLNILLEAEDADGDPLHFEIVEPPRNGSLTGSPPNIIYIPNGTAEGMDFFSYRVTDGVLFSNPAVVSIEVTPSVSLPLVSDQVLDVREDQRFPFTLVVLDRPDLFIRILEVPEFGTVFGAPPNLVYQPATNFFGSDSMSVEVSDPNGLTNRAVVYFDVAPANDPPVAYPASLEASAGESIELPLLGEDVEDDELTFEIVDPPRKGTITSAPPRVLYQPNPGESGADSLTFRAYDGASHSPPATISIQIRPAPVPVRIQALLDPAGNVVLRWNATPGRRYRVVFREQWSDQAWLPASEEIQATSITARWNGTSVPGRPATFYAVEELGP